MLQTEFENRVKMSVSVDEYKNIIEPMYMAADVDKDEFCRLWVKMNHKRVATAIKERKEAEKEMLLKDRLFNVFESIDRRATQLGEPAHMVNAEDVLNSRERRLLEDAGIEYGTKWIESISSPLGGYYRMTSASDVRFELHKKYGFAY